MEKKKKIYIIINPFSGTISKQNIPENVYRILDQNIFDIEFLKTEYAGHGYDLALKAVAKGADYVIAVGGDGTVNEIGRALVGSETTLGIIPLGSGNGLARELNIPRNVKNALKTIAEQHIISIDYGIVNDHIFFCTCGVGFDAVVAERSAGQKNRGTLMYFKNMLESFFSEKPKTYEIIYPGGHFTEKAFVVTCANASQYGYEAHIAPHADIQDGKINLAILQPLDIQDIPKTAAQLFARTLDNNKKMLSLVTNEVIIKREKEGVMHIDGDPVYTGKEIRVNTIPLGIKVLVPKVIPKKHPLDPEEIFLTVLRAIH